MCVGGVREQCSQVKEAKADKAVDSFGSVDVSSCVNEGGKCFVVLKVGGCWASTGCEGESACHFSVSFSYRHHGASSQERTQ